MSLSQYKQHSTAQHNSAGSAAQLASTYVPPPSVAPRASAPAPRSNGYAGRSITPMRYQGNGFPGSSVLGGFGNGPSILNVDVSGASGNISASSTPPTSPSVPKHSSSSLNGNVASLTKSMIAMRAPSVDRFGSERASSLRATLHTDTLGAASRPRATVDRNFNQSADIGSMRVNGVGGGGGSARVSGSGGPISGPPGSLQPRHMPVARTLAPNGQPRKVPVSILPQYHAGMAAAQRTPMYSNPPPGSALDNSRLKSVAQLRYGLQSK